MEANATPLNHSPSHERLASFREKMFHYYLFILHIINPAAVKLILWESISAYKHAYNTDHENNHSKQLREYEDNSI